MQVEDVLLVRRMMDGDREAFDELMKKTQREIIRLAYLISGSYADSEDIVQETYVQVYICLLYTSIPAAEGSL